jgi:hypothetical protein
MHPHRLCARLATEVDVELASDRFDLRHAATAQVSAVIVPERRLFVIDGIGPPHASDYGLAGLSLRAAAVAVGAALGQAGLPPPGREAAESLWWPGRDVSDGDLVDSFGDRRHWHWEQLVAVPAAATDDQVSAAIDVARRAAGRDRPLIRTTKLVEGRAIQLLAVGGLSAEAIAFGRLLDQAASAGLVRNGPVHLIHLTTPDLVPSQRLRSIVRIPVAGG